MTKYLLKRLLRGAISIVIVIGIVMLLVYSLMNRKLIFANDPAFSHQRNNDQYRYMYSQWEEYGYLDYVPYGDYINSLLNSGEIDQETFDKVAKVGATAEKDSAEVKEYVQKFTEYYESKGYTIERYDAVMQKKKYAEGGAPLLLATKDYSTLSRVWDYFSGIVKFDTIHSVKEDVGDRGLTFYWKDPAYGGDTFSPCLMGNGTTHKYLIYTDNKFPFIHQNMISLNLGVSNTVDKGVDITTKMNRAQGTQASSMITFPTGLQEESADDLHSAKYAANSLEDNPITSVRFTDEYTNVELVRNGKSKLGYSFAIGIIEVILSYLLGFPLGVLMARKKGKFADKLGTFYIVFIISVPSLAYIFLFRSIGSKFGLPTMFEVDNMRMAMYVLPIVSLMLPSIANLMKWMRRFMIDQMSSDYVKFARSGGLSEREIFNKHIMKNASVPLLHDLPASILFALTGAIITERVYSVPGVGNLLVQAINKYDNNVIVGLTLFYGVLSVLALIFGDLLMALVDPRISFSTKDR